MTTAKQMHDNGTAPPAVGSRLDRRVRRHSRLMTLEEAVRLAVEWHGGVRATERATGVDKSFISRLMRGEKVNPSTETLTALGLRAVPLYERLPTEHERRIEREKLMSGIL